MVNPVVSSEIEDDISVSKLLRQLLFISIALVVGIGAIAYFFYEPLKLVSESFTDLFGAPGIALAFFLQDFTNLPLPPDIPMALARLGGISFLECVLWGSIGSISGGACAFFTARRIKHTKRFHAFLAKPKGNYIHRIVERYGVAALAIGALTPLPFSLLVWVGGAFGLHAKEYFLVSLLRPIRIALYLYLIEIGFLNVL